MIIPHQIPNNALITITGTVGVGKSTLTEKLANILGFKTSMEKVAGNPYLADYYADFKKWSFHLQIYFLAERYKQQKLMFESGYGYVQDRSIYEDVSIFARLQYEKGNMSERDYDTYKSLFEAMTMTPYFPQPHLLIYLEGSIDHILAQIRKRGRQMELDTPLEFWEELHERYCKWIEAFNDCPVLRVNIEEYDIFDSASLLEIVERISDAIHHNPLPDSSQRDIILPADKKIKILSGVK